MLDFSSAKYGGKWTLVSENPERTADYAEPITGEFSGRQIRKFGRALSTPS
jgi:hypothetical protein